MFLVLLCTMLRLMTLRNTTATIMIHLAQFSNGLATPMAMSLGPTLSSTWFPVHQRVLATACLSVSYYVGIAVSFVAGSALVPSRGKDPTHEQMELIRHDVQPRH